MNVLDQSAVDCIFFLKQRNNQRFAFMKTKTYPYEYIIQILLYVIDADSSVLGSNTPVKVPKPQFPDKTVWYKRWPNIH